MPALAAADIHARLLARFGAQITAFDAAALQPCATVEAAALPAVATMLRHDPELQMDNLACLSAVDWPKDNPPRLDVVYHLFSYVHRHAFVLRVALPREDPHVPTVETAWPVANWHEREAFDLFGIVFDGHSDLRRILLPDDWPGHPLRRDWTEPESYQGLPVKARTLEQRLQDGEAVGVGPYDEDVPRSHGPAIVIEAEARS